MNEAEVLDIARNAILVLVQVAAPVLLTGLTVGLIISLFQALTSIQEMTLTFVPKIIAVFLSLIVFLPTMYQELADFTTLLIDTMINVR